jgi:NAD(P)-dependent dehydrogenase (short-subunit alcohol dehydrogenase family)
LTSPASWRHAIARTLEFSGRLDLLHLNAGRNDRATAAELTDEMWADQLELNLSSALYGVRAAIDALDQTGNGAVVVTSSIHAIHGIRGYPAYAAAKAGLLGLVRHLRWSTPRP